MVLTQAPAVAQECAEVVGDTCPVNAGCALPPPDPTLAHLAYDAAQCIRARHEAAQVEASTPEEALGKERRSQADVPMSVHLALALQKGQSDTEVLELSTGYRRKEGAILGARTMSLCACPPSCVDAVCRQNAAGTGPCRPSISSSVQMPPLWEASRTKGGCSCLI